MARAPDQPAPRIATAAFAQLPALRKPNLSPDGHQIVARAIDGGRGRLVILNADNPEGKPKVINIGDANVAGLQWAGNQRLLLTVLSSDYVFGTFEVPILRLIAIDVPTGSFRVVDRKSKGMLAGDVLYADPTGSWALVASQNDLFSYPSVKRVDLATGNATLVEKARDDVWDWYADDDGVVRAGIAYEGRRWTVWYRDKAGDPLRKTRGKFAKDDDSAVDRVMFGPNNNGWIVTNERTGRFGLYRYDFESGAIGEAVFEHPEVDLDDVNYDPTTGTIYGISYQDDRPRMKWIDPERQKLQQKLDRALPSATNIIIDTSRDEKRYLIWSGGASDPGRYFLLDTATWKMHAVVDPYVMEPTQLAEVRPVQYQARDGLRIRAYLTTPKGREAKALPLVLLPHGGPFARDDWTYDPIVQFLANRGYAVLQPQFRGSTGYGRDFASKGYGEFGKKMQDDLDDGIDWLAKSGQIDPKRVCIMGMSYGGYAALWGAVRNPDRYRCAISWAGVSDLDALMKYDRKSFSAVRYFREWRAKIGGEGKKDLANVSPINFADKLKTPIFIGHGEKDARVPVKQGHAMVDALTKANADVTSVFYKDSSHDFDSGADFNDWLTRLDAFLARHNPA
ncbi:MAG TPA: S9 family peptidase [Sphingomicrobium sp.]|nr:S9 family peptidase [Sphingomicrobium sp.]